MTRILQIYTDVFFILSTVIIRVICVIRVPKKLWIYNFDTSLKSKHQ
jgi:hypothetical protein